MDNMSDLQRKNFMDTAVFGQVINTQGRIAISASKGLSDQSQDTYRLFQAGKLDEFKTRELISKYNDQITKELTTTGNIVAIGRAHAAGVGGQVGELGTALGHELAFRRKDTKEAIENSEDAARKQKISTDFLTNTVTQAALDLQNLSLTLQNITFSYMGRFTELSGAIIQELASQLSDLDKVMASKKPSLMSDMFASGVKHSEYGAGVGTGLGAGMGFVAGSAAGPAGTLAGTAGGAYTGGMLGTGVGFGLGAGYGALQHFFPQTFGQAQATQAPAATVMPGPDTGRFANTPFAGANIPGSAVFGSITDVKSQGINYIGKPNQGITPTLLSVLQIPQLSGKTITSLNDMEGSHAKPGDPHYAGKAADIRAKDLSIDEVASLTMQLNKLNGVVKQAFAEDQPGSPWLASIKEKGGRTLENSHATGQHIHLETYKDGGVRPARSPAIFGEGDLPEAAVPLPDGRNIPVDLNMGGLVDQLSELVGVSRQMLTALKDQNYTSSKILRASV
jgi:hypothetical protein